MSVVPRNTSVYVLTHLYYEDGCGFVLRGNKSVRELKLVDRETMSIRILTQRIRFGRERKQQERVVDGRVAGRCTYMVAGGSPSLQSQY